MDVDKVNGTLRQRPAYSITKRKEGMLSININPDDPRGRKFLEVLRFSAKAGLRRRLNSDLVNLYVDMNDLSTYYNTEQEQTATE